MRVLIACEFSGVVREAFHKKGHDAWSCDLIPTEIPGPHILGDVLTVLEQGWDLMIAHPPCTYLCSSGLHWNKRDPLRQQKTEQALRFIRRLLCTGIPKVAIENPIGCISTRFWRPDQIIQPYWFGDDASKATCLWLQGLPTLRSTDLVQGRLVGGKTRYANQTDSGQNRLGPSPNRAAERARTYQGIADAMAQQWG